MRITWFVISPHLAAVNQAQSTKTQLFGPGSLGLCAKEKSTLTLAIYLFFKIYIIYKNFVQCFYIFKNRELGAHEM